MNKKIFFSFLIFIAVSGVVSCEPERSPTVFYPVDPKFREFYDAMGGEDVLGLPISPLYESNGRWKQFTTKVQLGFNPNATPGMTFYLVPLGLQLTDVPLTDVSSARDENIQVFDAFVEMYQKLGGTRYVGHPLTGVIYNPKYRRIEQYFESVGFYQFDTDPPGVVHLLEYGAYVCAGVCSYEAPANSLPDVTRIQNPLSNEQFQALVERPDMHLTGEALSGIYVSTVDGRFEQIFENLVIYNDPNRSSGVGLRPLPLWLGIPSEPPSSSTNMPNTHFIPTDGDLGYDVPLPLDDYIRAHGGYEFIGNPITHYKRVTETRYRQCFENLCLEHFPAESGANQVRPMRLGRRYMESKQDQDELAGNSLDDVTITVWEEYHLLDPSQMQIIHVLVRDGDVPFPNVELTLTVTYPDGKQEEMFFPPTDVKGQASVLLAPIAGRSGDSISYKVCMTNLLPSETPPKCALDDFVIWVTR